MLISFVSVCKRTRESERERVAKCVWMCCDVLLSFRWSQLAWIVMLSSGVVIEVCKDDLWIGEREGKLEAGRKGYLLQKGKKNKLG